VDPGREEEKKSTSLACFSFATFHSRMGQHVYNWKSHSTVSSYGARFLADKRGGEENEQNCHQQSLLSQFTNFGKRGEGDPKGEKKGAEKWFSL